MDSYSATTDFLPPAAIFMRRVTVALAHCRPLVAARLAQRVPAIFDRPRKFSHATGTDGYLVFKLDRSLDVPVVVPDQSQHFRDRRPGAEGRELARAMLAAMGVTEDRLRGNAGLN
jgi:hypothetical protein